MNTILPSFLLIISAIVAISGFFYSINDSKSIFLGKITSIRRILLNSLIFGISGMAFVFAIFMFIWFTDQGNGLTNQNILSSIEVSIIPGIFLFFVSLWRFFLIGNYRDRLFKKINKKKR